MLFDLGVKKRKEDFFNYEDQYIKIKNNLYKEKLISIVGLRRIGKSSLMSVIFHEIKEPKVWIDGRRTQNAQEILLYLEDLASQVSVSYKALSGLSSVELGPITFSFKFQKKLEEIDNMIQNRAFVFIDEVQQINHIDKMLSYLYDHTQKITFIVAGSEIGMVDTVLGGKGGPMAGRLYLKIDMTPLSDESARVFLNKGFAEAGKNVPSYEITDAITKLGKLPGWLTYYGNLRLRENHSTSLQRVIDDGKVIVSEEINHFLASRRNRKRYLKILKILSSGQKRWQEIYNLLKLKDKKISKSRVTEFLSILISFGFVSKDNGFYQLSDPMINHYFSSAKK
ncbi:AAA family ATPase [Candidatus Micrarchaeota archaeon]|nr:AAA family ATPase [Candidatus Micrarchaeota archaeon]